MLAGGGGKDGKLIIHQLRRESDCRGGGDLARAEDVTKHL